MSFSKWFVARPTNFTDKVGVQRGGKRGSKGKWVVHVKNKVETSAVSEGTTSSVLETGSGGGDGGLGISHNSPVSLRSYQDQTVGVFSWTLVPRTQVPSSCLSLQTVTQSLMRYLSGLV